MKFIYTAFFVCFSLISFSQSKWFIEANVSPNYTFRTASSGLIPEEGKIGGHLGFNIGKTLKNERMLLKTGLKFSKYGEIIKLYEHNFITGSMIIGDPTIDPALENLDLLDFTYSYRFIGIPVELRYDFGEKGIKWYMGAGIETTFFINGKHTITKFLDDGGVEEEVVKDNRYNFRAVNWCANISFGIEVSITEQWFLNFQPIGQIHVMSTSKAKDSSARLYAIGGQLGLRYLIQK